MVIMLTLIITVRRHLYTRKKITNRYFSAGRHFLFLSDRVSTPGLLCLSLSIYIYFRIVSIYLYIYIETHVYVLMRVSVKTNIG